MAVEEQKLVKRSQKVAYMDTATSAGPASFERMTGFTALTNAKNPKEYSRQYIDEDAERSDVVGYAPSIEFSFDRHLNNKVHEKIVEIFDKELVGNDTHVDIVTVDLTKKSGAGEKYHAVKRKHSIVPDSDGDGTDAMIYSGTFKAVGAVEVGNATFSGNDFTKLTYAEGPYEG